MHNEGSFGPQAGDYGRELVKIGLGVIVGVNGRIEDIFNKYLLLENQIHNKIISNFIIDFT